MFWLGFGAENAAGFFAGVVFLGFGVSSLFLSLPLLLPLLLSGGRLGCLFFSFACSRARIPDRHPVPGQAGAASTCSLSFLLSALSARVGRPPPLFLPPSAFSLSLSLSLSLFSLSLSLQACAYKRFTARLQMAPQNSNDLRSASSHMDNCGKSRANTCDTPDFWGMIVIMSHRIGGVDTALPFG